MTTSEKRRDEIIGRIKELTRLRRGQISEQYFEKPDAEGVMKRFGPYYVWQAYVNGEKRSVRVGKDQVEQVQQDVKCYQEFKQLCDELAELTEQMTLAENPPQGKKNATSRKRPSRRK